MEQLDNEILQDIQEQMNQCTTLSIRYISILSGNFANIPNAISSSECQQILKKLLTSLIMENNPSKVLSFLSVPISFVTNDEQATLIIEETKKALDNIRLCWQDRLLDAIFN